MNPAHIEPVPPSVNTLRGESFSAVYRRRTHCPQGHEYTTANVRIYRARRYCRACNNAGGRGRRQAVAA